LALFPSSKMLYLSTRNKYSKGLIIVTVIYKSENQNLHWTFANVLFSSLFVNIPLHYYSQDLSSGPRFPNRKNSISLQEKYGHRIGKGIHTTSIIT
jgi:hypothetical protein